MSAGLHKTLVPVLVDGSLDTKTNPKLVPLGSLLELENLYQLRTGEMRLRNGFSRISLGGVIVTGFTSILSCWKGPNGTLCALVDARDNGGFEKTYIMSTTVPVGPGATGGASNVSLARAPDIIPVISNVSYYPPRTEAAPDHVDPDSATNGSFTMTCWTDAGGAGQTQFSIADAAGNPGSTIQIDTPAGWTVPAGSRGKCAAGGSTYLVFFAIDDAVTPSLKAFTYNATGGGSVVSSNVTVALNAVAAAAPWFDVKPIPGSNNIAVAYRASAGGVTCLIFNPATGAVTSVVNTAGADSSMCLGWLDDPTSSGSMLLATAGSVAGVVVRTMSATTMVVSATLTIDATSTASVNNVTGSVVSSTADYLVLWDVYNATTYNTRLLSARVTAGVPLVATPARSIGLYSRTFRSQGKYYVLAAYESPAQSTFFLCQIRSVDGLVTAVSETLYSSAGKRRVRAATLSTTSSAGSGFVMAASRQTQITSAAGGVFTAARVISFITIPVSGGPVRPVEINRSLFVPGGMPVQIDGAMQNYASHPLYPEAVSIFTLAGGSLTPNATYSWVVVYAITTSDGRVIRSAPSVPVSATLGPADTRAQLTIPCNRVGDLIYRLGARNYYAEIYRAGPAASGDTTYQLVGRQILTPSTDTIAFLDAVSDAVSETGEFLYTTGRVLENLPPPPGRLSTACGNRWWVVNSETPTELWFSKEIKAGVGVGFHGTLKIRVDGDGSGEITALESMDGRVIAFKASAIYVISGDGPDDTGSGQFNKPQAITQSVGTTLPDSVVVTPDGIMFQSAKGIYLLDRGLALTYIGEKVEQYTMAGNVVGASLVNNTTQVRFVFADGRCLVWDYHHRRWYVWQLRADTDGFASTIVGCADLSSGWCYVLADGTLMQETPGVFSDVSGALTTAIVPRVSFPHLALAGINGFQRLYAVYVLIDVIGNHTLSVDCEFDYSGAVTGSPRTKALTTATPTYQAEYNPPNGKGKNGSVRPVITTSVQAAGSGAFRLTGLTLKVGIKKGSSVPFTNRLT